MKPIIGIVGRSGSINNKNIFCIYDNYRRSIIKAGGIPIVLLPPQDINYEETLPKDTHKLNTEELIFLDKQISLCQGLIIPGGNRAYHYDLYICSKANQLHIPLLGTCLGMQIMCNYNNTNKNIINPNNSHNDEKDYTHKVIINNNKLLTILNKKIIKVNSHHNYHVANSGSYKIAGLSEDNLIEAIIKEEDLFNIGVQWHPEKNYDEISEKLFTNFIKSTKKTNF